MSLFNNSYTGILDYPKHLKEGKPINFNINGKDFQITEKPTEAGVLVGSIIYGAVVICVAPVYTKTVLTLGTLGFLAYGTACSYEKIVKQEKAIQERQSSQERKRLIEEERTAREDRIIAKITEAMNNKNDIKEMEEEEVMQIVEMVEEGKLTSISKVRKSA